MTEAYIFIRRHALSSDDSPPMRMQEPEARALIAASGRKGIDRAIKLLKRGGEIRTAFGTYSAKKA